MSTRLEGALQAVIARTRLRHGLRGAALGFVTGAVALLTARAAGVPGTLVIASAAIAATVAGLTMFASLQRERTPVAAAAAIERTDRTLHNLVVTAQEIMEAPGTTREYMRQRVLTEA